MTDRFGQNADEKIVNLAGHRALKQLGEMLTAPVPGPAHLAEVVRLWRFFLAYGTTAVVENTYPALTKCWHDLHAGFHPN